MAVVFLEGGRKEDGEEAGLKGEGVNELAQSRC